MRLRSFLIAGSIAVFFGLGVPASSQVTEASSPVVEEAPPVDEKQSPVVEELKQRTPDEIASGQTEFWARTLRLTPEQAGSLRAINLRYANDAVVAAKTASASDSEKLAAIETLESQKDAEVVGTLSPEQSQQYQAMKQRMDRLVAKHIRQGSVQDAR